MTGINFLGCSRISRGRRLRIYLMALLCAGQPALAKEGGKETKRAPQGQNSMTLYCDVTEQVNDDPPAPVDQRVFTVDYRNKQIYVVKDQRRTGEVLVAKAITEGAIELPDIQPSPESRAFRGATERIDRLTGNYAYQDSLVSGPIRIDSHVIGVCHKGSLIPIPQRKF